MKAEAKVTTTVDVRILKIRRGVVTVQMEGEDGPTRLRARDVLRVRAVADLGVNATPDVHARSYLETEGMETKGER